MTIWLNGQLLENGTIDASSAGVTLGWGVFTTVGVRGGVPLFSGRHVERLQRDASEAGIDLSHSPELIRDGIGRVLEENAVIDGLLRLTLTQRGDGRWNSSLGSDLSIQTVPVPPTSLRTKVQLSPYRVESQRPLAGVKTTAYLPYFWAWKEAKAQGFDEAILRDGQDFLSEAARSNLFWTKNDQIFMPSLATGCLRGLGRDLLLEWAASNETEVQEGEFSYLDALDSNEAFLVSAASGPKQIFSWHDETGRLLRDWDAASHLAEELQGWWEQEGAA